MIVQTALLLAVFVTTLCISPKLSNGAAAPLPKSTDEMLKKLKLDAGTLANIDKELEVPKAWLDGARKEGKLRVFSTFDPGQFETLARPFKERYPYIAIEYSRARHNESHICSIIDY